MHLHTDIAASISACDQAARHDVFQLPLAMTYLMDSPNEFVSYTKMERVLQQAGLQLDEYSLDSLIQHLNRAVAHQQRQPVKAINSAQSELITYWDTWGLIRDISGQAYVGMLVWHLQDRSRTLKIASSESIWHCVVAIGENFSPHTIYQHWIEAQLNAWQDDNQYFSGNLLAKNQHLVRQLSDSLLSLNGSLDTTLTDIFETLFSDFLHPHHLAWLAANLVEHDDVRHEQIGEPRISRNNYFAIRAAIALPFPCAPHERNLLTLYGHIWRLLNQSGVSCLQVCNGKTLLALLGFSQNGRERLYRLNSDEIDVLLAVFPSDAKLLQPFMAELQHSLSKVEQIHRRYDQSSRPQLTPEVASILVPIAGLRYFEQAGKENVSNTKFHEMLPSLLSLGIQWHEVDELISDDLHSLRSSYTPIGKIILMLELYRDELLLPREIYCEPTLDNFSLDMIQDINMYWQGDDDEQEIIPSTDEPRIDLVTDWLLATNHTFSIPRKKLNWKLLEKLSDDWHAREKVDYSGVGDYPDWNCLLTLHQESWEAFVPTDLPYLIVPLTTQGQLIEESSVMRHCVASYAAHCFNGHIRIFSVRNKENGKHIATAELREDMDSWQIIQLKGRHNAELIQCLSDADNPICRLLKALTTWYNHNKCHLVRHMPQRYHYENY
jgi:hypothetical protein